LNWLYEIALLYMLLPGRNGVVPTLADNAQKWLGRFLKGTDSQMISMYGLPKASQLMEQLLKSIGL
jgi:hypothetical protein